MWRIKLSKEYRIYKFTDRFIEDILVWASENQNLKSHDQILNSKMSKELHTLATYTHFRNVFRNHMLILSRCSAIKLVLNNFRMYKKNYRKILRGAIKPPKTLSETTIREIENTFKYFYESLLDAKILWTTYNSSNLYKTRLDIRTMLGESKVCPYCDKTNIDTNFSSNMDHFLPVSKYPFLSMHWQNIVTSCVICNGLLVKSNNSYLPILHPYFDPIEDLIYFSLDKDNRNINIRVKSRSKRKKSSENLIRLLKYKETYSKAWAQVEDEQSQLNILVFSTYQFNKGSLKKDIMLKSLNNVTEFRKNELKRNAGMLAFSKLRYDVCEEYRKEKENDRDFYNWLIKEQTKLLSFNP